jgi:hypothetical protein
MTMCSELTGAMARRPADFAESRIVPDTAPLALCGLPTSFSIISQSKAYIKTTLLTLVVNLLKCPTEANVGWNARIRNTGTSKNIPSTFLLHYSALFRLIEFISVFIMGAFEVANSLHTHLVAQRQDLRLNPPESYLFVQDGLIIICGVLYALCYFFLHDQNSQGQNHCRSSMVHVGRPLQAFNDSC